jgi:hypothetical protein
MEGKKMNEVELFVKSLKDFFTKPILKMTLYPFFITLLVMYATFFMVANLGLDNFHNHIIQVQQQQQAIENGEVVTSEIINETYFGKDIINFLLQYSITSWLVGFLVYTLGTIFVMFFALFITLIVVGFLTPFILKVIQKKHYPTLQLKGYGNLFNTFWILIKSFFVMLLLFIVLIPLYFIPVLNILIINIPLYYFFYKLLNFDITSTIMSKQEEAIIKVKSGNAFHIKTVILYLISMIPFIVLFSTVFYVIYLGHGYLSQLQKLREFRHFEPTA